MRRLADLPRIADLVRIPAVLAVESGMVLMLHRLGDVPALRIDAGAIVGWAAATPPVDALAAVVRVAALGLACWLLLTTVVYLLAEVSGLPSAIRAAGRVTVPAVRRLIERGVTVGVLAGTLAVPLSAGAQTSTPGPPAYNHGQTPGELLPPGLAPPAGPPPTAGPVPVIARTPRTSPTEPTDGTAVDGTPDGIAAGIHPVVPGDDLWTIARRHVAGATGGEPDPRTVARYWWRVVEDNRERLRSGDPDLIFPGETVRLPPLED